MPVSWRNIRIQLYWSLQLNELVLLRLHYWIFLLGLKVLYYKFLNLYSTAKISLEFMLFLMKRVNGSWKPFLNTFTNILMNLSLNPFISLKGYMHAFFTYCFKREPLIANSGLFAICHIFKSFCRIYKSLAYKLLIFFVFFAFDSCYWLEYCS